MKWKTCNTDRLWLVRKLHGPVSWSFKWVFSLLIVTPRLAHANSQVLAWGEFSSVAANLTNVTEICTTLALTAEGAVVDLFTGLPTGQSNAVAIASGADHSLALKADGTVVAWGDNFLGQTNVSAGLTNVVAIAAGADHSLALKADGSVVAWGYNQFGSTDVPAGLTNVVAIAAGYAQSLALTADGRVVSWGAYFNSGDPIPSLSNVVGIAAGFFHSLALRADGTATVWGLYGSAQSIDGFAPAYVPFGLNGLVALAGGESHSLALKADGTVVAWGKNGGQTNVPADLTNVVGVAAGGWYHHVVADAGNQSLALVGDRAPVLGAPAVTPRWEAGKFSCSVPTQNGRVFRLEFKNSLADAEWKALSLAAGNGSFLTLIDSTATSGERFYRVQRW